MKKKARERRVSASVELPDDIIVEIISRLPVKILLQFKCVCKSWNSLISNPNFVLSTFGRGRAIMMGSLRSSQWVSTGVLNKFGLDCPVYSIDEQLSMTEVHCPLDHLGHTRLRFLLGTYNGMVLVYANRGFWMWNPSTRSCRLFCQHHDLINRFGESYRTMFGLCFDKRSDDYKVVLVTARRPERRDQTFHTIVQVASLKNWRIQNDISFPYKLPSKQFVKLPSKHFVSSGVLMRGHLHWIVTKKIGEAQLIVYFDEEVNQFRELPMPEYDNGSSTYYFGLTVLDGCLSMSRVAKRYEDFDKDNDDNDVLIMAEYGVKESWTKMFTIKGVLVPLRVRTSNNLVLVLREGHLYTYDLKRKKFRMIEGLPKPLEDRSCSISHKATGVINLYNLRDKVRRKFDFGQLVFDIYAGPIMYAENLASVVTA